MWDYSTLWMELIGTILVLITKDNAAIQVLGLIEVLWKVVEAIIDTQIKTMVTFHDFLHGFCAFIGTGAATMKLNMAQDIASISQDLLSLVLLYLWKAYDKLDPGHILNNLKYYRTGPKMWGILVYF